jgi:hypothetical protein
MHVLLIVFAITMRTRMQKVDNVLVRLSVSHAALGKLSSHMMMAPLVVMLMLPRTV